MADRRDAKRPYREVRQVFSLLVLWGVGLASVLVAGLVDNGEFEELFLDPAYLSGRPWYTGLFTHVMALAWAVAATSAAGGAWVAHRSGRPNVVPFLAVGSGVTGVLLIDDVLQLHATVLPSLGLGFSVAKVLVVAPVPLWLITQRDEIARTRWSLLGAALSAFVASLLIEAGTEDSTATVVAEDSAKLLGVLAWAHYFVITTVEITRSVIDAHVSGSPRSVAGDATPQPSPTH